MKLNKTEGIKAILHIYNILNCQNAQCNKNRLRDKQTFHRVVWFTFCSHKSRQAKSAVEKEKYGSGLQQFQKNFKDFNTQNDDGKVNAFSGKLHPEFHTSSQWKSSHRHEVNIN